MATLEKIRSKQKLLFTVVIIALFLFIISIASADSIRRLFGPGTTIAQVGKQKIDYQDYREFIDRVNQQQQNQQQKMDHDELSQMAIQQLAYQAMYNDQVKKLGINVTDNEISRVMLGNSVADQATQQFLYMVAQYLGLQTAITPQGIDGKVVLDAITNPSRYGFTEDQLNYLAQQVFGTQTMAQAWVNQENMVEKNLQQAAFQRLITGLFTANKLDAQAAYDDNANYSYISYVSLPFNPMANDTIEVSDADLRAKYEQVKSTYKLNEPTREVDFIVVNIVPSKADIDAAEVEVDRLAEALAAQPGVEGAMGATAFLQEPFTVKVSEYKKNRKLAAIPEDEMTEGAVHKFGRSGNNFTISKVLEVKNQIDSINLSIIPAVDMAQADSIMQVIADRKKISEVVADFQAVGAQDSVPNSLVGAPDDLATLLGSAPIGKAVVYNDSIQSPNPVIFVVNGRKAPEAYADVVLFSYEVFPSNTTTTDIKTQLNSFLASNSKGDAFSANADSLYTLRHSLITPSTPMLGYVPSSRGMGTGVADTRAAIKWAMNAKKGEVSHVFDNKDSYVVVAVKEIYDGPYMPYTAPQVKDALTAQIKADKQGQAAVARYAGKANDLNGYATLMGTEVRTDSTIVFGSPYFATFGPREYALQGQVGAAQKGVLVGPVAGSNGVMVFVVDDTVTKGRPFDLTQDGARFKESFGSFDPFNLIIGNNKIKNNSLQFENYDR